MTTLKDISRLLNLSVTQVSRAINDHADVSEDTKRRVREAAKSLNYHPNMTARSLVTGRSGIVGLVLRRAIPQISSAYHMEAVISMSRVFGQHGMQFVLHVAGENENLLDTYRRLIKSGSLDGFVLFEATVGDPRIPFLQTEGVPFVLHGRTEPQPNYPFFDIDNHLVGYTLTRHLIEHGHRRIAFINGPVNRTYVAHRWEGYCRAMSEAGLEIDPNLHRCGDMTKQRGLLETIRLLDTGHLTPTAFIASNARIARGVYDALDALGQRVPDDISVVAHDDAVTDANLLGLMPSISATRSPIEASWKPLAEFLVGAVSGQPLDALQRVEAPDFEVRGSVGPTKPI